MSGTGTADSGLNPIRRRKGSEPVYEAPLEVQGPVLSDLKFRSYRSNLYDLNGMREFLEDCMLEVFEARGAKPSARTNWMWLLFFIVLCAIAVFIYPIPAKYQMINYGLGALYYGIWFVMDYCANRGVIWKIYCRNICSRVDIDANKNEVVLRVHRVRGLFRLPWTRPDIITESRVNIGRLFDSANGIGGYPRTAEIENFMNAVAPYVL